MPDERSRLSRQRALVTGGNSGIGAGIVRALARAGASVAVNYVADPEAAERLVATVRKDGGTAIAIEADVAREEEVGGMFDRMTEELGGVDILVSNAGIQRDAALTEMSLADWRAVIDVNLTGAFLCAREAARRFLAQGIRPDISSAAGKIVFVSSVHEVIPWAKHANYAASKGGLSLFMKSVAQELAPHRIRVNSVAPGAIKTPINEAVWSDPERAEGLRRLIPYGRIGETADVARVVVWLASDEADYVNGTAIFVDGGMTLFPGFATGAG